MSKINIAWMEASLNGVIVELYLNYLNHAETWLALHCERLEANPLGAVPPARCSLQWTEVGVDERVSQWTNGLPLCLQIIRLINVFTPQKSLEEFQDLWVAVAATIYSLFFCLLHYHYFPPVFSSRVTFYLAISAVSSILCLHTFCSAIVSDFSVS